MEQLAVPTPLRCSFLPVAGLPPRCWPPFHQTRRAAPLCSFPSTTRAAPCSSPSQMRRRGSSPPLSHRRRILSLPRPKRREGNFSLPPLLPTAYAWRVGRIHASYRRPSPARQPIFVRLVFLSPEVAEHAGAVEQICSGEEKDCRCQYVHIQRILCTTCWSQFLALHLLSSIWEDATRLSGQIPNMIGAMQSLVSLDLSENKLSGEIPSSLSNLSSLAALNLSYNNLSGSIPSGRQLDTLNSDNPSIMYIGNSGLCGPPLQKNCPGNDSFFIDGDLESSKQQFDPLTFHFGLVLGLVVGLWVVFCALLFKRTWRIAYFRLFDEVYDQVYVFVVVKWASYTKNTGAE